METIKREYFDIELKNQSKKLIATLHQGLTDHGGIIHDLFEQTYFSGKQAWRNPLLLRVSFPVDGSRWKFISQTRIWASRLPVVGGNPGMQQERPIPLRGKHDRCEIRRSYCLAPSHPWIKDYVPNGAVVYEGASGNVWRYNLHEGEDVVQSVLDGDLDILSD